MTLTAPVVPTLITPALTAPRVSTSRRPLRVLVAPSGFKESLGPDEVAAAIAAGVRRAAPDAHIRSLPLVDGGEGFTKALVGVTGGSLHDLTVTGPVGEPVPSYYGFLGGPGERTAVLEMAAAAGLRLVPREHRNPAQTTTYGVGELVRAALGGGAARLLVGCMCAMGHTAPGACEPLQTRAKWSPSGPRLGRNWPLTRQLGSG